MTLAYFRSQPRVSHRAASADFAPRPWVAGGAASADFPPPTCFPSPPPGFSAVAADVPAVVPAAARADNCRGGTRSLGVFVGLPPAGEQPRADGLWRR
jgi:hypothetical protein